MQKIILYASIAILTLVSKVAAQDVNNSELAKQKTFEQKAKEIAINIKTISSEEKEILKREVENIDARVKKGEITNAEGQNLKTKFSEERAKNIENRIAEQETALRELVNGNIEIGVTKDSLKKNKFSFTSKYDKNNSENKTTSQFVVATGFNNLVTNGALANSQFGYARSTFYEIGFTWNTRLSKNSNLLHLKYGVGFMYNMLHATNNQIFADINNQTILVNAGVDTKANSTYFKNVYFVVPLHLEFDFSKTNTEGDKKIFKSHDAVRFGIGGFVGVNTNSKQFIEYKSNGYTFSEKQKGSFNVNDITYGLSAYVGHKQTSLYLKYDLNPMFKNNLVDQNNISLGVRFDIN